MKSRASLNQPAATRALCELRLAALDAHPDNPRLVTRDDVVESIARQLTASGEYGQEHAILVRPVGERYQIIAGHHRVAAARAAGFATIWGWVRDLDDERAFMELVLANAQGELAPLEIGLHALRAVPLGDGGRGKKGGLSDYAKAIGKTKQYVSQLRDAATVLTSVKPSTQVDSLLAAAKHLHAIHAADPRAWPALVAALLRDEWSVADAEHWVSRVREFVIPERWAAFLPFAEVADRFLAKKEFSPSTAQKLCALAEGALAALDTYAENAGTDPVAAAKQEFLSWLVEKRGVESWDMRAVMGYQKTLEERLKTTEREDFWFLGDWRNHLDKVKDGSVTLLLTDPPYGMGYQSDRRVDRRAKRRHDTISNDGDADAAYGETEAMLQAWSSKMDDDAHVLVFCHWSNEPRMRDAIAAAGLTLRGSLIWLKNNAGMGDPSTTFAPIHERILHAVKGSPVLFHRAPDVLQAAKTDNALHPTQKPTDLLQQLIEATTVEGQLVADPFGGSASTLIAARAVGRRAVGCELDPQHFETGAERLRS